MKKSVKFLPLKMQGTKTWFFAALFLIVGSIVFVGCSKDFQISNEESLSETSGSIYKSGLIDTCGCLSYLITGENMPSFSSAEDFREAYNCLSECHDNWLDQIEEDYPNITSDEFDVLVEQGLVNELEVFDNFATYGNYSSLLRKDLEEEDEWLENGAIIAETPEDIVGDDVLKAMIDENGHVKINGETIDIVNTLLTFKNLKWCTPYGVRNAYFYNSSVNYKIRLRGGMAYIPILGSYVYGKITAYKKKSNGDWKRNRENLDIAATCNVRKSPLNSCEFITFAPTGWESKKTKSLTVTKWNWFGTQIWYKKTYASSSTNPDGLVTGYSDNVSTSMMGF